MPFSSEEIRAINDDAFDRYIGRYVRAAENQQQMMWRLHADELVGVPEVEPFCPIITDFFMFIGRHAR